MTTGERAGARSGSGLGPASLRIARRVITSGWLIATVNIGCVLVAWWFTGEELTRGAQLSNDCNALVALAPADALGVRLVMAVTAATIPVSIALAIVKARGGRMGVARAVVMAALLVALAVGAGALEWQTLASSTPYRVPCAG